MRGDSFFLGKSLDSSDESWFREFRRGVSLRSRVVGRAFRGFFVLVVFLFRASSGEAEAGGRRSRRSVFCDRVG